MLERVEQYEEGEWQKALGYEFTRLGICSVIKTLG